MLPSRRAAVLFALSIPLALIILAVRPDWWFASFYYPAVILALTVADMSMSLPFSELGCTVLAPGRITMGAAGSVCAVLGTEAGRSPLEITGLLELGGPAETQPAAGILQDGRLTLALPVIPLRRGRVTVKAVWLRWQGPFRLAETRGRLAHRADIDVIPGISDPRGEALPFFSRDAVFGSKNQPFRGSGTEFDRLSEFRTGMEVRYIDWKRSARHRRLLCKEFREERSHHVVLGFDTGQLMTEPIGGMPRIDHAVRAGLLLARTALRHGDLIGGCEFDSEFRRFLQPGRSLRYFSQLQRFTAGMEYRLLETNFTLGLTELGLRLHRRTLVIVFSEFADSISAELLAENLELMARRHAVIFVTFSDPLLSGLREEEPVSISGIGQAVLADVFLRERAAVLERIARAGVHIIEVPARSLPAELIGKYLMIKQGGML